MGWTVPDCTAALERLAEAGLVANDELTDEGRSARDEIERATDRQERALAEALGANAEELFTLLDPWARAVVTSGPLPWEGTA
jgi:hypothetical protein